jgi:hypothetical protein
MAEPRVPGILDALTQLTPLFLGSGKTTGSATKSTQGNSSALAALTNLLTTDALNPSKASSMTSAAQKNAINLMLQQGVPQIAGAERGSGIYNSSQTAQAMSQLEGQTAAAAAKLELDQANTAAQNQTQAATSLGQMSSTITANETSKTAPVIDPVMAALGLGGMMLGNSLLKGKNGIIGDVSALFGSGGQSNTPDFTPVTKPFDLGSMLDIGGFTKTFATDIAGAAKNATYDPVTGGQNTGGGKDVVGALSSVASSTLLDTVGSFIGGLFGGGSSGSSGSSGGGEATTYGSVLCTLMHELGYISDATYAADSRLGERLKVSRPKLIKWYHSWAVPLVAYMRQLSWKATVLISVLRWPVVAFAKCAALYIKGD